jgi:putative tryptophan/tyrosine transport system substrate-binding protein
VKTALLRNELTGVRSSGKILPMPRDTIKFDADRRGVIALLSTAAAATFVPSREAWAQQAGRIPTIGYLGSTTAASQIKWTDAFVSRLREFGWIDGRTVTIDYRWAEGRPDRGAEAAADFVRRKVDVIVTNGTPMIAASKKATTEIPIVFAAAGDPVGTGLVASLSRPGGNVTGLSLQATDLAGKHIELLREILPGFRRLAFLLHPNAQTRVQMAEAQAAARSVGIEFEVQEIWKADDIPGAIERVKGRADALYVMNEPLAITHRAVINALALDAQLPTVYAFREFVDAGGLISYGPSFPDLFRRAAGYVDRILRGAKPADLPVEQPTAFDLVINLKTAKGLGLELPAALLARADEVIE